MTQQADWKAKREAIRARATSGYYDPIDSFNSVDAAIEDIRRLLAKSEEDERELERLRNNNEATERLYAADSETFRSELALREQRISELEQTVSDAFAAFTADNERARQAEREVEQLRKANEESIETAREEVRALFPEEQIIISIRDCGEETTTIRGTSLEYGIQVGMNGREFDADDLSVTLQLVRDFAARQSREDKGK